MYSCKECYSEYLYILGLINVLVSRSEIDKRYYRSGRERRCVQDRRHRTNPNMPFWKMLKEGSDHFEVTHMEPKVDVCDRHYVFDAQQPADSTKSLAFSPSGHCPAYEVADEIAGPALEKQRNDEYQIAQLTRFNTPVAPIVMGTDGGMNRVFVAKLQETQPVYDNDGHIHAPPVHPVLTSQQSTFSRSISRRSSEP